MKDVSISQWISDFTSHLSSNDPRAVVNKSSVITVAAAHPFPSSDHESALKREKGLVAHRNA